MYSSKESAVLLIVFNRPETTSIVFEAIRKAKPKKLYVAADAPREANIEDINNCVLVKKIVKKVDWECDAFYRFSEENQGCGPGPYNAISWAFQKEDRLIILEDDCVPAQSFFNYCNDLLERYLNDLRIWLISGNQYNEEAVTTPHSYFFSKYGHTWGWATWKRCWQHMDMEMSKLPLLLEQNLFGSLYRTKKEATVFRKIFQNIFNDKSNISHMWDFQFDFALKSNNELSILPAKNLVKNIGYLGTHSDVKNQFHDRPIDENFIIISHPDFILCDVTYDVYHFENHWNIKTSIIKRISRKIIKLLKGRNKN